MRSKKKNRSGEQQKKGKEKVSKGLASKKPFQILEEVGEDEKVGGKEKNPTKSPDVEQELVIPLVTPPVDQVVIMEEDGDEEMELGELDLNEIEKECEKKEKGYVSRKQLELLQEAIIRSKARK